MEEKTYFFVKVTAIDAITELSRTIAIEKTGTFVELQKAIASVFQLSPERGVTLDIGGEVFNSMQIVEMGLTALTTIFAQSEESMLYTYYGMDEWQFSVQYLGEEAIDAGRKAFLVDGTGQGIFNHDMTVDLYNEIVQDCISGADFDQLTAMTTLPLQLDAEAITELPFETLDHELLHAIGDTHDQSNHHHAHDDTHDEAEDDTNILDVAMDEHLMQEEIVDFYINVIGLTEEQASYHVLYEMSVNNIIQMLYLSGFDDNEVDAVLSGKRVLEEDLYNQLKNDFDILHALPHRDVVFSQKDEQRLADVEEILFNILEKNQLSIDDFQSTDDDKLEVVEEEFLKEIQLLDKQQLS